ncbi:hypothetical protein B0H17DRAFT_1199961 [Mycena rosella]|uniref:Uncharacterized protein n=1 Tax=Mycena rosella TaxID=1033263 RepID=A0AAD7DKM9_MYCRO|nr:hypothetical protein B0H17DRAFT_1199961 [Mycena rosella]
MVPQPQRAPTPSPAKRRVAPRIEPIRMGYEWISPRKTPGSTLSVGWSVMPRINSNAKRRVALGRPALSLS